MERPSNLLSLAKHGSIASSSSLAPSISVIPSSNIVTPPRRPALPTAIPSPSLHVDFLSPSPAYSSSSDSSVDALEFLAATTATAGYRSIFPLSSGVHAGVQHPGIDRRVTDIPMVIEREERKMNETAVGGRDVDAEAAIRSASMPEIPVALDLDVNGQQMEIETLDNIPELPTLPTSIQPHPAAKSYVPKKSSKLALKRDTIEETTSSEEGLPIPTTVKRVTKKKSSKVGMRRETVEEKKTTEDAATSQPVGRTHLPKKSSKLTLRRETDETSPTMDDPPTTKMFTKKSSKLALRRDGSKSSAVEAADDTPTKKSVREKEKEKSNEVSTPTKLIRAASLSAKEKQKPDDDSTPTKTRPKPKANASLLDDDEARGCTIPDLISSSPTDYNQETIGKRKGALKLGLVPIQTKTAHLPIPFPSSEPPFTRAISSPTKESFGDILPSPTVSARPAFTETDAQSKGSIKIPRSDETRKMTAVDLLEQLNSELPPLSPASLPSPTERIHPDLASLSPPEYNTSIPINLSSSAPGRTSFTAYSDEDPLTDSDLGDLEEEFGDGIEDIEEEEDPDLSPLFFALSQSKSPVLQEAWDYARMILIPPKRSLPSEVSDLAKQLGGSTSTSLLREKDDDLERTEAWIAMHAFARASASEQQEKVMWNGFVGKLPSYFRNGKSARMEAIKYKASRKLDVRLLASAKESPADISSAAPASPNLKHLPSISSLVAAEKKSHSRPPSEDVALATWRTVDIVNELPMAWSATPAQAESAEKEKEKVKKEEKKSVSFRPLKWMRRGSSKSSDKEKKKKEFSKVKTAKGKSVLLVGVDGPVLDWFYDPRPDQYSHSSFSVNLPSQMATVDSLSQSVRTRASSIKYLKDRKRTKSRLSTSSRRSLVHFAPYEGGNSRNPKPSKSMLYLLELPDDRKCVCIEQIFKLNECYAASPRQALDDYETVYLDIRKRLIYPALRTLGDDIGRAMEIVVEDVFLGIIYDKLYTNSFKLLWEKQDHQLNTVTDSYRQQNKTDLLDRFHCRIEDAEALTPACHILASIDGFDEDAEWEISHVASLLDRLFPGTTFASEYSKLARFSRTPQQVLAVMGLTVEAISHAVGESKLGGEELAGLVAYVVIQSGVKDFYSLLNYTRRFTHFQRALHEGHIHYLLATFDIVLDDLISNRSDKSITAESSPEGDEAPLHDAPVYRKRYCNSIAETNSGKVSFSSRFNKSDLALVSGSQARDALTRALSSSRPSPDLPPPSSPSMDMRRGASDGPGHAKRVSFDAWSLWGASSPQRSLTPSSTMDNTEDGSWIGWGRKRWSMTSNAAPHSPYSPSTPASPEIPPLEDKSAPQNRNRRNSESAANLLNSRLVSGHSQAASDPTPAVVIERAKRPRPKSIISLSSVAPNVYPPSPNSMSSSRSGHRSMRSQHGPTGLRREVFAVESAPLPPKLDHSMAIALPDEIDADLLAPSPEPGMHLQSGVTSASSSPFFMDTRLLSPPLPEGSSSSAS
ncbi:hypothetical protein BT69DRAFT_1335436 [Atractiella rhizophila]|nr:hypothetical protein BT69DRAFT_1335436 [Atractiella rhizophila]